MPKAVRFNEYGGIDVLHVVDVERPKPGPVQVLVQVKAAGINPGEASVRKGLFAQISAGDFSLGRRERSAGVVAELGKGVDGFHVGDEVLGFTDDRASHAELVLVDAHHLVPKPKNVAWEVAGSLFVAGTTAYAAVRAVSVGAGETVVVSGAAGGVGSLAVQLARNAGARVIGLASEKHHEWLSRHGVFPVLYGEGGLGRIRATAGGRVDAFIDTFGADYVEQALELGVKPGRIDTIINFAAVEKHGVKADGSAAAATAEVLNELVQLIAAGRLEVPIAKVFPLADVQAAYRDLEQRHSLGKIVLRP